MTDLTFDRLGIWAVVKREKSGLEALGFYNCYAGIDQLKCLVVRLDNFEKETMKLGVAKMYRLFVNDKDRFAMELEKIDKQIKAAKRIYKEIENKHRYNLSYFKNLSSMAEYNLKKGRFSVPDKQRVSQILNIKDNIDEIIRRSSKPLDKIIELNPTDTSDLAPVRDRQDYTLVEDNFIIDGFTSLSVKQISEHLGRTKNSIYCRMRRLREEGRL